MVRLKWDNEDFPMYQTGVSHGVFYGDDGVGHAWSGLISVTEKPQNNAPTAVYNAMGEKYDNFGNVAEKKHGLACYIYPEVMDDYLGYEFLEDFGFMVDERPPKKFHMAYRVELGNGLYEIHVLLNQIATFGETARQTIAEGSALSTITMNLEGAVDPRLGTSHIRMDSRLPLTKSAEVLLFGDQYTDPSIHEFLTAEPVWETIATNYAPIIEPDYDNYVWLGGENLVEKLQNIPDGGTINTSDPYYSWTGTQYHLYNVHIKDPGPDSKITITIKGSIPAGRTMFRVYSNGDGFNDPLKSDTGAGNMVEISPGLWSQTFTFTSNTYPPYHLRIYSGTSIANAESNPGTNTIEWVKIEKGSTATPWTPAGSDSDQKPRPTDPFPENYKPGVKYGAVWDSRNQSSREVIAFYDEHTGGVGVYSYAETDSGIKGLGLTPYRRELHQGSTVKFESEVILHARMSVDNSMLGRIRIQPNASNTSDPIPNVRGTYNAFVEAPNYATDQATVGRVFAYRGGFVGDPYITYRNWLATTSNYTGEFFDVHTTPKTRGERYQRVVSQYGDYTEYQQLRLRSTAKVKLSDITQYDFWLEAADTMLLSQNETFTFNGPQAVINGDTFTIDDSIQGYAEG